MDTLVAGTPLIAPYGTYPNVIVSTLIPGYPGFRTSGELIGILDNWNAIGPTIRGLLLDVKEKINEIYSPRFLVSRLVSIAESIESKTE